MNAESQPAAIEAGAVPTLGKERNPITTRQLMGEQREIAIEHEGQVYRLRVTRNGKLILQK